MQCITQSTNTMATMYKINKENKTVEIYDAMQRIDLPMTEAIKMAKELVKTLMQKDESSL